MNQITVVSRHRTCYIEVTHRDSHPDAWIVLRWSRTKLVKKRISTHSFVDKKLAFAFANAMKRNHEVNVQVEG